MGSKVHDVGHCILFTDENRATLDGPDSWSNGWVYFGNDRHQSLRRQWQSGGVMLWAGTIRERLVGPIRVPEGVKMIATAECNLLNEVLIPWLDDIPLSLLRSHVFIRDNAPSHSSRVTQVFLGSYGIQDWVATSLSGSQPHKKSLVHH